VCARMKINVRYEMTANGIILKLHSLTMRLSPHHSIYIALVLNTYRSQ